MEETRDAAIDREWDALVTAVDEAWTWRDPDSVATLAVCLVRLQARVRGDWEELERNA